MSLVHQTNRVCFLFFLCLTPYLSSQASVIAKRKQLVRRFCEKRGLDRSLKKIDLSSNKLYVDDKHKFIYCHMPRTASTTWLGVLLPLNGKIHKDVHHKSHMRTLANYTTEQAFSRLRNYFKFVFVREPFQRLLSAYKTRNYYKKKTLRGRPRVSFPEFVRYFISNFERYRFTRRPKLMWKTIASECAPCHVDYNFIGHYKTLGRDANFVLKKLGVENRTKFPSWKPTNTSSEVTRYYNQLSTEQRRALYEIMKDDYEMFGYSTDPYV